MVVLLKKMFRALGPEPNSSVGSAGGTPNIGILCCPHQPKERFRSPTLTRRKTGHALDRTFQKTFRRMRLLAGCASDGSAHPSLARPANSGSVACASG